MKKQEKFNSGVSFKSNMSYEKYLHAGLSIISQHLSVRVYKLAPKDDYPVFERGRDIRVQIYWKKESMYEFIIEQSFWYQSNRNKEDRKWMRHWADPKLESFKDAVVRGKKDHEKKKKKTTKKKTKSNKVKVGFTQNRFEEMKKTK